MPDANVRKQAREILNVAKMLRHHVLSSLAKVEDDCVHGDLSLAQMNLVLAVRARGEVTLTGLAESLSVSPPSVSVMVDRLVERGLLQRDRATSDRRKVVIQVSPGADQHIAEMEDRVVATFVELLEELGPDTAAQWHGVLKKVEKVLVQRQIEQG